MNSRVSYTNSALKSIPENDARRHRHIIKRSSLLHIVVDLFPQLVDRKVNPVDCKIKKGNILTTFILSKAG